MPHHPTVLADDCIDTHNRSKPTTMTMTITITITMTITMTLFLPLTLFLLGLVVDVWSQVSGSAVPRSMVQSIRGWAGSSDP
jgi:hypothetical protein